MARRIHDLGPVERFAAVAVGQPGQRAFFLQARRASDSVTVALEKIQVAALADRLQALVSEIRRRGLGGTTAPTPDAGAELEEPLEAAFRVGTLSLAWDGASSTVVVEAMAAPDELEDAAEEADDRAVDDEPPIADADVAAADSAIRSWADDDPAGPDLLRVRLNLAMAEAFAREAQSVVQAGRPACPMCGQPLDPQGHLCPRRNGHAAYLN